MKSFKIEPEAIVQLADDVCRLTGVGFGERGAAAKMIAQACAAGTRLGSVAPIKQNAIGMSAMHPDLFTEAKKTIAPKPMATRLTLSKYYKIDLSLVSIAQIDDSPLVELCILRIILDLTDEPASRTSWARGDFYRRRIAKDDNVSINSFYRRIEILTSYWKYKNGNAE